MTVMQWIGLVGTAAFIVTWLVVWIVCQISWWQSDRAARK